MDVAAEEGRGRRDVPANGVEWLLFITGMGPWLACDEEGEGEEDKREVDDDAGVKNDAGVTGVEERSGEPGAGDAEETIVVEEEKEGEFPEEEDVDEEDASGAYEDDNGTTVSSPRH